MQAQESTQEPGNHTGSGPAYTGVGALPAVLLLVNGILIGLSTCLAKVAADHELGPLAFLAWSALGATAILALVSHRRGTLPRWNGQTLRYFLISGLVTVAVPQLLLFAAVPHVGTGFVVLSIAFPPLYTYLGALLLRMEGFHPGRAFGVVLALTGALTLALEKLSNPDADPFWVGATLLAPVFLAAGNLYRTARWPVGAAPDGLAPGMMAATVLMLFAFGLVAAPLSETKIFAPGLDTGEWIPLALVIAQGVTLAASYLVFFTLQKLGGPVYLSLIGSVAAVFGVPFAVFVLDEPAPAGLALAGTLIASGVLLLTTFASRVPKPR